MATIKITREKEWFNRSRIFEIHLDGKRIDYISNGETKQFEIAAGQHKLRAKMERWGSRYVDFTIFNNETKSFSIATNRGLLISFFIILIGGFLLQIFLQKIHKTEHVYKFIFTIILTPLAIYSLTLGRYTYLKVKEG